MTGRDATGATPAGTRPTVTIRLANAADAAAILTIYNFEVDNHTSTFDIVSRTLDGQLAWLADRSGAFAWVSADRPTTCAPSLAKRAWKSASFPSWLRQKPHQWPR